MRVCGRAICLSPLQTYNRYFLYRGLRLTGNLEPEFFRDTLAQIGRQLVVQTLRAYASGINHDQGGRSGDRD